MLVTTTSEIGMCRWVDTRSRDIPIKYVINDMNFVGKSFQEFLLLKAMPFYDVSYWRNANEYFPRIEHVDARYETICNSVIYFMFAAVIQCLFGYVECCIYRIC